MKKIKINLTKIKDQLWNETLRCKDREIANDTQFAIYSRQPALMIRQLNLLKKANGGH